MCRPLWIGGGITRRALTLVFEALDELADKHSGTIHTELKDLANAAWAELTKSPADIRMSGPIPTCTYSGAATSHVKETSSDLLAIGRRDSAPLGGG